MAGGRVGCLLVLDLPLAALLRAEPGLCGRGVVVCEGDCVLGVGPEARRVGVTRGMSVVRARSMAPGLLFRVLSAAQVRSARAALADVARSFSPRVCLGSGGEVFLDAGGLGQRHASERELGSALVGSARRVGLQVRVGIGAGMVVARLAAATIEPSDGSVRVVEPGDEREFLAPLPVSLLPSSARVSAALRRFGIERLGQLAKMPSAGLGRRLGPEALRLWRLARGEDPRPLVADREAERFVEESEPGWAVDRVEPLLHELSGLLQRLSERLACRGLCAQRLDLSLQLDPDGRDERVIELASPTRQVDTWLSVARLSLERQPPCAPVAGLRVEALPAPSRSGQLDLFARAGAVPSAGLDDALARLSALAGHGRVGSPRVNDSHRPDDFCIEPLGETGPGPPPKQPPHLIPLRAVRPPLPVQVQIGRGRPVHVRGRRLGGRVRRAAGPWRLQGDWWQDRELDRDYYDVELVDGGIYRMFLDRETGEWFVDGICG